MPRIPFPARVTSQWLRILTAVVALVLITAGFTACVPADDDETVDSAELATRHGDDSDTDSDTDRDHGTDSDEDSDGEEVELAILMGEMQRHSAKLGYAVQSRNPDLAAFYLEETEEVLEAVRAIETFEGMPIAHPTGVIMDPLLPPLEHALEAADWPATETAYESLIAGCNRCHTATEHGFLVIEVPRGSAPYNQRFEPPSLP